MIQKRPRLTGLLVVAFLAIPNSPHRAIFDAAAAVPEVVCGWLHSDQDRWRCDLDPLG